MNIAVVHSVHSSSTHSIRKESKSYINIIEGFGVEDDAHAGKKVKHRYLVKKDPERPNLRQVHFISKEIYEELLNQGFSIKAGEMGENITTKGIDIMNLPVNTILRIGGDVELKITGMREPCHLLDQIEDGLMKATVSKNKEGQIIRKAGIMSIVIKGGIVQSGDPIEILYPKKPWKKMETV